MKQTLESFTFSSAGELRDWLNGFKLTELDTVNIETETGLPFVVRWELETLTDGSKVNNMVVK